MRLFTAAITPRSSPELVRHSQVPNSYHHHHDHGHHEGEGEAARRETEGKTSLGRKFSKRFQDIEAARKLRMASPNRKYQWSVSSTSLNNNGDDRGEAQNHVVREPKKRVSRVDSFRNFISLATSTVVSTTTNTLKTPRAVKRRSRHGGERKSSSSSKHNSFVDVSTSTEFSSLPPNNANSNSGGRYESELALSECQSEADLRYYSYQTDEEDERSVVSDGYGLRGKSSASRSAGNLVSSAMRLGILPENRTINFGDSTNAFRMKNYGMIDGKLMLANQKFPCWNAWTVNSA